MDAINVHFSLLSILWCIDPLLSKNLETNNERTAIAIKWRGKHACTTIELLLEMLFSTQSVERGYKEDNWNPVSLVEFCKGG
jgi:hypothetical protein